MCPTCVELWIMSEIAFQSKKHYQRMQETLLSSNFGQKILSCQTVPYGTLASMEDFKTKYYQEYDPWHKFNCLDDKNERVMTWKFNFYLVFALQTVQLALSCGLCPRLPSNRKSSIKEGKKHCFHQISVKKYCAVKRYHMVPWPPWTISKQNIIMNMILGINLLD